MQLKITAPDGKSFAYEIKPGEFHWVDSKVTHTLTNEGPAEGQIIEIELKYAFKNFFFATFSALCG